MVIHHYSCKSWIPQNIRMDSIQVCRLTLFKKLENAVRTKREVDKEGGNWERSEEIRYIIKHQSKGMGEAETINGRKLPNGVKTRIIRIGTDAENAESDMKTEEEH